MPSRGALALSLAADALGIGGAWAVLAGLHRLSPPAALIVGGAMALGAAWFLFSKTRPQP